MPTNHDETLQERYQREALMDERMAAEANKSERRAIEYGDIVHRHVLVMRAAVVAWKREGAEAGMRWIANTLFGPGHLPSDEDIAMGAQALFDKEVAEHEAFRAAHQVVQHLPADDTEGGEE